MASSISSDRTKQLRMARRMLDGLLRVGRLERTMTDDDASPRSIRHVAAAQARFIDQTMRDADGLKTLLSNHPDDLVVNVFRVQAALFLERHSTIRSILSSDARTQRLEGLLRAEVSDHSPEVVEMYREAQELGMAVDLPTFWEIEDAEPNEQRVADFLLSHFNGPERSGPAF